jgi:hypothetical protein
VDAYLEDLIETLEHTEKRILVIYTSDHGQSVLEPEDGVLHMGFPHATPLNPPVFQAMVPLMLFGIGEDVIERLSVRCDASLRDRVTGFEIFSTALILAGYDYADIRGHYYHSLFDLVARREDRVFASGNIFERDSGYHNEMIRGTSNFYLNSFEPTPAPASTDSSTH